MKDNQINDPLQINNAEQHDVRYFAMLNNAVAISGDSRLEGGTPREALAYYNYLLNLQLPNCPTSLKLTNEEQHSKAVKNRMMHLLEINTLLEKSFTANCLYTDEGLNNVITTLDMHCKEDGACYLPSGYSNLKGGHFAGIKIRKLENGHYAFSCINHGEGMHYHQKVSISGGKVKYSYQSDEYDIDLQSNEGREFLQKILELRFDSQQKSTTKIFVNPYSSDDLYGLLKVFGKEALPEPFEILKEKSVTPQRTGTCPITNTHAVARDSLIDNRADFITRKRYHFVMKLRSLISAFDQYRNNNCDYTTPIMEWALNEFSVRLNKQYRNILSDDEIIYCSNLQTQMKTLLNQRKEAVIKEKCEPKPYPYLVGDAQKYGQHIFDKSKLTNDVKPEIPEEEITIDKALSTEKVKPENIIELLQFDEKANFPFKKMYDLFNTLPHCSGFDVDEFWDKVPREHLKSIIASLFNIIKELKTDKHDSPEKRARYFALSLIAYDIAAQIAPRYSEFKLSKQFALGLDDIYTEQSFYSDPIVYHTVKRVAKNFGQRAYGKERVFSNAVNYANDSYDHTVNYVINILLNNDQRRIIANECSEEGSKPTDKQLFKYLMDNLDMKDEAGLAILDKSVVELIAIAGTAQAVGNFTEKYKLEDGLWAFSESQFHREVKRKSQLQSSMTEGKKSWRVDEIAKHLPTVEHKMNEHTDYAENTIFHPYDNLVKIRDNTYSSNIPPYQPKLSGSIRDNSEPWQPKDEQQFLYEELNEDLRRIECAPNFQIVKTFDWAVNNLDLLRINEVRIRINELLFQYGKLDRSFANNLDVTLSNMQTFLESIIKYCAEEASDDIDLIVWSANIANKLRYHLEVAAKLYNLPISQVTIPSFKEFIFNRIQNEHDADVRSRLASQLIGIFRNTSPLTVHDCCQILLCRVAASLGSEGRISDEVWTEFRNEVIEILSSNNTEATDIINTLFSSYKITTIKEWKLVGLQLQAIDSNLYIDLTTGLLRERGEKKFRKERTERTISENKELFDRLRIPTSDDSFQLLYSDVSSYSEAKVLKSVDGKWEFNYWLGGSTGNSFIIDNTYQILNIEGVNTKFKLLKKNEVESFFEKNPFESNKYVGLQYQYWQSLEDNDVIFVRDMNAEIAYTFSKDANLILISPSSEDDFNLEKLRSISKENNNNPILIKCNNKISIYAFHDNEWKVIELDNSNAAFIQAINNLKFPTPKKISTEYLTSLEKAKQKEIDKNGSCDDWIEEMILKEKNRIEKQRNKIDTIVLKSLKEQDKNNIISQEISRAHTPKKNNILSQLTFDSKSGEWQRSSKILLNLVEPKTKNEQEWATRLGPMFGTRNVRCTAFYDKEKLTWELQSIEHLVLNLTFSVNEQKLLMCNEEPGFYLSNETSLKALAGLQNIIILQNDKNEKKYIIPAFSLKKGDKNNAFNYEDIIDFESLCNESQPYYIYTLNNQNELETDSVEGNLYLAILYRSSGDFEKAIKYLDRCKKHENIDPKIGAIAFQILTRKIQSPLSAAFNLKLACYLKEHQSKWSDDKKLMPIKFPDGWDEFITKQLDFYNKTYSSYKKDVAIIPSYLRITESELSLLPKIKGDLSSSPDVSERIQKVSKLDNLFLTQEGYCGRVVDHYLNKDTSESPDKLTTLRLYGRHDATLLYILKNFHTLFFYAINNDHDKLNKILFSLLQNDEKPEIGLNFLITFLIMVRDNPEYFTHFTPLSNNLDLIKQVGDIFYKHGKDLENKSFYLFNYENKPYTPTQEASVSSDFIVEPTKFDIAEVQYEQECKQPLTSIRNRYFTKNVEAISQRDFALELSGLPNATLLEKKLFDRYKLGHEKNKNKMMPVYSLVSEKTLSDLKTDLEILKKKDDLKLNALYNSLLKHANFEISLDESTFSTREKALAHNLAQACESGQKRKISMTDLFTAFLQKDPSILTQQNPFLKQKDIEQLFANLADYALLHSRVDQTKEALTILGDKKTFNDLTSYQIQSIAGTLDKPRAYDIRQYPEFLVYEYATHRLLREDQANILINLIELIESKSNDMHHALLQFAAGGGKTSVLIPILAQRFASQGFIPVIINTSELYDIGLEDIPRTLRDSFSQNLEVIDRELDYKWSVEDFKKLLKDLQQWNSEGKCLLIKSISWHSINIAMKSAYFEGNTDLAKSAEEVLNFLKYKSVKLEDECHLVSDPLQQCIKAVGKPQRIPSDQIDFLIHCYDYLMGRQQRTSGIESLSGIKSNRKSSIREDELDSLQNKLSSILVHEAIFNSIPRDDLITYLLPKNKDDKTRPGWLENLLNSNDEKKQQIGDLIVLARAFVYTHLPYILSLQYGKDYGTSIHKGDLTVAPKHEGNDVNNHFGDHTLVAALSIQLYEQRGLLPEQIDQLIAKVIKEHKQERKWNHDFTNPTQAELFLINIIPSLKSIKDLTPEMKNILRKNESISKNIQVIQKYLREFVLPQIEVAPKRITSTPAEMQAGFTNSILFSATPSLPEIYPPFITQCFLEEAFEAQVIDTLLQEQNKKTQILMKPAQTPADFFEQFKPELLVRMTTLIDRGSLLTHLEAKNIIKSYLDLDMTRVPTHTAAFFTKKEKNSKQKMKLKTKDPTIKKTEILGAALVQELKKQKVNPEKFLLFLFLDLSKTTGTDIKRPSTDHAGLTVGKEQTVTETIQAAMRERQLLDKDAQSITWLMFQALYREINPCELISIPSISPENVDFQSLPFNSNMAYVYSDDRLYYINKASKECKEISLTEERRSKFNDTMKPTDKGRILSEEDLGNITAITDYSLPDFFDPRQVFYWMIKNEAKEIETKLVNRANQGIYQAISELAWKEVQKNPLSLSTYEKALEDKQGISPSQIYEIASKKDKTEHVLRKQLDQLLAKFNFAKESIPEETMSRINKIIKETSELITELQDPPKTQLGVEVQQEMQQEQEQKTEVQQHVQVKTKSEGTRDFEFSVETYTHEDYLNTIFNQNTATVNSRYQILQLPGCSDIKSPELLFCPEHFAVTQHNQTDSRLVELKPITNLLVKILPGNKMQYLACTAAGMEYYAEQMRDTKLTDKYPAYAIISTYGSIFQTSNNISISELRQAIVTDDCQKMLTYTHFLNGEVSNPVILSQIIKEQGWDYEKYEKLANGVANVHVSQRTVSLLKHEVLETYSGWTDKKVSTPMISSTFQNNATEENMRKESQQKLRPVDVLENHIETADLPTSSPKHALGCDLLGMKPEPIDKNAAGLKIMHQPKQLGMM